MEYERIHKVQTGIISPSKLRMKLIGAHQQRKKDGSNSNSSRTSPSKLEDAEFVKDSLLNNGDFDEEASSLEVSSVKLSNSVALDAGQSDQSSCQPREFMQKETVKMQQFSKSDSGNSSSVHPVRTLEEENLDYDSNASSSSFEFHKGERSMHNPLTRSLSRPMSSKWNDAEKWIMNRQNMQANYSKKTHLQSLPAIRSVSMRDMGTEMTPIPSQEPSRTGTLWSTTPLRSPNSSIPSSPRGAPAPTPNGQTTDDESQHTTHNSKKELSDHELKLKTRQEIVALGVQLGKMNIAAWASKDEGKNGSAVETGDAAKLERIEFEKRAAAWEEAEKTKHAARYKREEIKIQAWESQQKAKLEAEMKRIEAQVEQMRTHAQAKMVQKIAMARQTSEEKRAAAEARRNRQLERAAAQAEYIRQTGQIASSSFICCGW
ncbi:Remorin 4.1 [Camellia lanceoleosa]|uniref:Remorin 4.1 n=1 Tax=Camellia lanceoleosa TaxID=1840588 RepID=A0ACC0GGW5_9ERIC|nr:Remorin 4.1 [Camellia lanceoleosa]